MRRDGPYRTRNVFERHPRNIKRDIDVKTIPTDLTDPEAIALYRGVADEYELPPDALAILTEACRALQRAHRLNQAADEGGLVGVGVRDQPVVHPAIEKAASQLRLFAKLMRELGLNTDAGEEYSRPAVSAPTTPLQIREA